MNSVGYDPLLQEWMWGSAGPCTVHEYFKTSGRQQDGTLQCSATSQTVTNTSFIAGFSLLLF